MGQLKGILIGILLGAIVAGAAAWFMVHQQRRPEPARAFVPKSQSAPQPAPAQHKYPTPPLATTTSSAQIPMQAPWSGTASAPMPSAVNGKQQSQAKSREKKLQAVMRHYRQMQRDGTTTDPKEVSKLLDQLEAANGSSRIGGIDINVLRHNLAVADKLSQVGRELNAEVQSPHPDKKKLHAYITRLNQLKGQLNMNFAGAGGQAAVPGASKPSSASTSNMQPVGQ